MNREKIFLTMLFLFAASFATSPPISNTDCPLDGTHGIWRGQTRCIEHHYYRVYQCVKGHRYLVRQ